jgi:putative endonuclease
MKSNATYYTYILSNYSANVLYIGMTNNLTRRFLEHKFKFYPKSFSARYTIDRLVHYECFPSPQDAIAREKQLKNWHRDWKINLIKKDNPLWEDLSSKIMD